MMLKYLNGCTLALASILGMTVAIAQPASAFIVRGIEFEMSEASFADEVVDINKVYAKGMSKEDAYSKNWTAGAQYFDDANTVLGVANSGWKNHGVAIPNRDDFSLGNGGSITVKFTDNVLVGSNNDDYDLWIFEAGGLVEGMFVEISKNGTDWISVGELSGTQNGGIDIDAFGFTSKDQFSFVRVTDNGNNTYDQGEAGVDIDAIGAISSVPKAISEPASIVGLSTDNSNNTYDQEEVGVDVDAIGAISSAPKAVSEPASILGLLTDNDNNSYDQGEAGIDVDAIGAISSASKAVSEPASIVGLLTDNDNNVYDQGKAGVDIGAIEAISFAPKAVPEPASILGLLFFGGVMVSTLKHHGKSVR